MQAAKSPCSFEPLRTVLNATWTVGLLRPAANQLLSESRRRAKRRTTSNVYADLQQRDHLIWPALHKRDVLRRLRRRAASKFSASTKPEKPIATYT